MDQQSILMYLSFRASEAVGCLKSWTRSLTFLGAHTASTYLIHTLDSIPKYLTWLFHTQEIQRTPNASAVHHWDFSLAIFLVCVICDLFREHLFKMNKMLFWSAYSALALQPT
jgi:hypothetical protein